MPKQSNRDYSKLYIEAAKELYKGRDVDEVIVEYSRKAPLCETPADQIKLIKAVENLERKKFAKKNPNLFELNRQLQQYKRYVRTLRFENQRFRRKYYSLKSLVRNKTNVTIGSSCEDIDVSDSETDCDDNSSHGR
ncbi:9036_t:CDS:1 [Paraglomus brasilianum]|uniref:9036_t:CDS:1 n=1 Tax=Paraglomus brasilianum TaxID=144538 RepID=A0A9N9CAG9_9GLOM|nr:9036_t:CDS:1 [Paraglomus brasilianum]